MLDLHIHDTLVRVVCRNPEVAMLLRELVADSLSDEAAPPGFVIQGPDRPGGFFVVSDRSGFVLARTRTAAECSAVVISHLGVFVPPPARTVRLRMQALLSAHDHAVLAEFPLFAVPSIVERRLAGHGYRLIDRLAIDVTTDGLVRLSPTPWVAEDTARAPSGHSGAPRTSVPLQALLVPDARGGSPSEARTIALLAGRLIGERDKNECLNAAEKLATLPVIGVDPDARSARYESLPA